MFIALFCLCKIPSNNIHQNTPSVKTARQLSFKLSEPLNRLPIDVVDALFLQTLKVNLDRNLSNLTEL